MSMDEAAAWLIQTEDPEIVREVFNDPWVRHIYAIRRYFEETEAWRALPRRQRRRTPRPQWPDRPA